MAEPEGRPPTTPSDPEGLRGQQRLWGSEDPSGLFDPKLIEKSVEAGQQLTLWIENQSLLYDRMLQNQRELMGTFAESASHVRDLAAETTGILRIQEEITKRKKEEADVDKLQLEFARKRADEIARGKITVEQELKMLKQQGLAVGSRRRGIVAGPEGMQFATRDVEAAMRREREGKTTQRDLNILEAVRAASTRQSATEAAIKKSAEIEKAAGLRGSRGGFSLDRLFDRVIEGMLGAVLPGLARQYASHLGTRAVVAGTTAGVAGRMMGGGALGGATATTGGPGGMLGMFALGGGLGGAAMNFIRGHGYTALGAAPSLALRHYRQTAGLGQTFGEGYGSGVGQRLQSLISGINPFDLVSNEVALAVIRGLRSRGLSEDATDALRGPVLSALNDLGVAMQDQILDWVAFVARETGQSFKEGGQQAVQLSRSFDTLADSLNTTTENVAKASLELGKFFASRGAGAAAPEAGIAFATALGGQFIDKPEIASQLLQALEPQLVAATGIEAPFLYTEENIDRTIQTALGVMQEQFRIGGPNIEENILRAARYGAAYGPLGQVFEGQPELLRELYHATSGDRARGIYSTRRLSQDYDQAQERLSRQRRRLSPSEAYRLVEEGKMTPEEAERAVKHGILSSEELRLRQELALSATTIFPPGGIMETEEAVRFGAFELPSLRRTVTTSTDAERQELLRRLEDPTFDIRKWLELRSQGQNVTGPQGSITDDTLSVDAQGFRFSITLDREGRVVWTEKTREEMRRMAERGGVVPSNTRMPWER